MVLLGEEWACSATEFLDCDGGRESGINSVIHLKPWVDFCGFEVVLCSLFPFCSVPDRSAGGRWGCLVGPGFAGSPGYIDTGECAAMSEWLYIVPVVILIGTTIILQISWNWRWSLIALAIQYLAVFWLISSVWNIGLAAVKLIVGLTAVALLGVLFPDTHHDIDEFRVGSPRAFQLVSAGLVISLAIVLSVSLGDWFPPAIPLRLGGLILIAMGLIQVGITTQPIRIILGLLTILSGFEVIYAAMVNSVLVTGLLAMVTVGMAMVGAYLSARFIREDEE